MIKSRYLVNYINREVKLKNVRILSMCMGTYCVMWLTNALGFHDTIWNGLLAQLCYARTLARFSFAERTYVTIFFLRWPTDMLQL